MNNFKDRLNLLQQRIHHACNLAGRKPESVNILAVSKHHPVQLIETAYQHGLRNFGENYLQEALQKIESLHQYDITWHFIGSIQSNKTRPLSENFHWIHTLSSPKIARRLNSQRPIHLPPLNVCIQINIDNEASKSGILPEDFSELAQFILKQPRLCLRGLMVIPAAGKNSAQQQETFHSTYQLLQQFNTQNQHQLDTLSMGMSLDLESAIMEHSTFIRPGTALFGPRPKSLSGNVFDKT